MALNVPLSFNKQTFVNFKYIYNFNKFYNSDGGPGLFCDMEDHEDTQDFDEYALTDVNPPGAGKNFSDYEDNEAVAELGEKSNTRSSHTVHI